MAPGRAVAGEAAKLGSVTYEDDFLEGRLIFQALPTGAPERLALRAKLLHYLLDPVLALKPSVLKREVTELEDDDVYDRDLRVVPRRTRPLRSERAVEPARAHFRRGGTTPSSGGRDGGDCLRPSGR